MKQLVFFSNILNHHQVNVADEFYNILGDGYTFVITTPSVMDGLKGGEDYSSRPYCIMASNSERDRSIALELARTSDVCIFGAESIDYAIERAKKNPQGLSFEVSERWLKKGLINMLSPRFIKWRKAYQKYFHHANFYKLNASAYASIDHRRILTYKNRQYKWGYFTSEPIGQTSEQTFIGSDKHLIHLMWCGRFIQWKHPDLAIKSAKMLNDKGYSFHLDMFGDGPLHEKMCLLVHKLQLDSHISFYGNIPNIEILSAMRHSDVFLFTSDRNEGWGAVANEAMGCGCCIVASEAIGSVPFLIINGLNGMTFKDKSVSSLTNKLEWLFNNPAATQQMRKNAFETISGVWSPRVAAHNFLQLVDDLKHNKVCSIKEGPASYNA